MDILFETSSRVGSGVKIHTSTLSHVEVAFGASEQARQALDPRTERRIDNLWADTEFIVSVEYHAGIGQIARSLIRSAITEGWSLKPLDAVHLATAQWLSSNNLALEEFQTYDNALMRYEPFVDFTICEPRAEQPRMI